MKHKNFLGTIVLHDTFTQYGKVHEYFDLMNFQEISGKWYMTIKREYFIDGKYSEYESKTIYAVAVDDDTMDRIHTMTGK